MSKLTLTYVYVKRTVLDYSGDKTIAKEKLLLRKVHPFQDCPKLAIQGGKNMFHTRTKRFNLTSRAHRRKVKRILEKAGHYYHVPIVCKTCKEGLRHTALLAIVNQGENDGN